MATGSALDMQENTMSIFILSSVYFMLTAIQKKSGRLIPVLLMAICIFLSAMCKGIQGTFTAITFLAYALTIDRSYMRTAFKYTVAIGIALAICGLGLYLYTPARDYFIGYYHTRIQAYC